MQSLYLDVCCINRPFDDGSQTRVHLEAEAVLAIVLLVEANEWEWVSSSVVDLEINQDPDPDRSAETKLLSKYAQRRVGVGTLEEDRAHELVQLGFQPMDALHLACAESGNVNIFLTTDDRLLRRATDLADKLKIRVVNPLKWMAEVSEK